MDLSNFALNTYRKILLLSCITQVTNGFDCADSIHPLPSFAHWSYQITAVRITLACLEVQQVTKLHPQDERLIYIGKWDAQSFI